MRIKRELQLLDQWSWGTERCDDEEPPTVELDLEIEDIEVNDGEVLNWSVIQLQQLERRVDGLLRDLMKEKNVTNMCSRTVPRPRQLATQYLIRTRQGAE